MIRRLRSLAACLAVVGLVVANGAFAEPQKEKGKGQGKAKQAKHVSGKDQLGDKIKTNGSHKLKEHGKFDSTVDVVGGKVKGIRVKHADKGDVPVTKYKTNKKMAQGPKPGMSFVSAAYAQDVYMDTIWIGFAFIDDWGYEVIYWFPFDMVYDGDTGAIEYYPAY